MKILIADDDRVSCIRLENYLIQWGYEVVLTYDGDEAWEALQKQDAPKLAVLDWQMPHMDGIAVICRLRARPIDQPYIYSLLLTSRGQKEDVIKGLEAGADDYLTKPVDLYEFHARVRSGSRIVELQDQLIQTREAMREQAIHDALTGVWNRQGILDVLRRELTRSARQGSWVSVMMIDIDHFKHINDTYGHLTGDAVLCQVACRMGLAIRGYDALGRYGGEEFLVVLPDCDLLTATGRAEKLRRLIEAQPIVISETSISLTISIGVAAGLKTKQSEWDSLLRVADNALYGAKAGGRNRVVHAEALAMRTTLIRPASSQSEWKAFIP